MLLGVSHPSQVGSHDPSPGPLRCCSMLLHTLQGLFFCFYFCVCGGLRLPSHHRSTYNYFSTRHSPPFPLSLRSCAIRLIHPERRLSLLVSGRHLDVLGLVSPNSSPACLVASPSYTTWTPEHHPSLIAILVPARPRSPVLIVGPSDPQSFSTRPTRPLRLGYPRFRHLFSNVHNLEYPPPAYEDSRDLEAAPLAFVLARVPNAGLSTPRTAALRRRRTAAMDMQFCAQSNFGPAFNYAHGQPMSMQYPDDQYAVYGSGFHGLPYMYNTQPGRHLTTEHAALADGKTESKPRLSKEEVEKLEKVFQENPKPSSSVKAALAEELMLERPRINVRTPVRFLLRSSFAYCHLLELVPKPTSQSKDDEEIGGV